MEQSKQTGPDDPRFRAWFNDLEDRHQTKWVYSLCRHVWQNITYTEFELWFDINAQDVYRRAADLEESSITGLSALGLEPFIPPRPLPFGFQEIWDIQPISDRTKENWKWLRGAANTSTFQQFILENQPYRIRFEATQDLHIREYYAAQGHQIPQPRLEGDWREFYDGLPAQAATTEILNELTNNIKRTRHAPPGAWWAGINPNPTNVNDFVDALCWRLAAEANHYKGSQELYPFRHSTYLGIRLPNRWRDWWANSDPRYRTSHLWRYSMANLQDTPQEVMHPIENDESFRRLALSKELKEKEPADADSPGKFPQKSSQDVQGFQKGETSHIQAVYGIENDASANESDAYGPTPISASPAPFRGSHQPPASRYQASILQQPPPEGYSCLTNSFADAAPTQREQDRFRRAASLFNSRNKPRVIGTSGQPLQGFGNYGWWGKYVDDGPQKYDETIEVYVERVNRARDNMRIQLRLRPNPPLRDDDESIEQYKQKLQVYERHLKQNEETHNNKMDDRHPQFDQNYRDKFQQTARRVHVENEARRAAAREYWDTEVARLQSNGGDKRLKTAELYRSKYRRNEALEADIQNLYEGWTDEDMWRAERGLTANEEDSEANDDSDDNEPKEAMIKCYQCSKVRQECSGIQYGTPTWNIWPCERCRTIAGGKYAADCGPRFSNASQIVNRKQKIKTNSTKGPYLVSWWARELSNVPRAPPPPDHWAVRIQRTFADFPRSPRATPAPTSQRPLFPRIRQTAESQGTATPSETESRSTRAIGRDSRRAQRSDRGKKHNYPPRRREYSRPEALLPSSRDIPQSRSASPSKGASEGAYRSRSPIRSARRCQRCLKRNRMCSAPSINERPCQECIAEGPDIAQLCISETTDRSGPISGFGYEPHGDQGGDMDHGGSGGYESYYNQRGGNQPGYDNLGSFEGFRPHGQPYGHNNQNRPMGDANGPDGGYPGGGPRLDRLHSFQYVAGPEPMSGFKNQAQNSARYSPVPASRKFVPLSRDYPSASTPAQEASQAAVAISNSQINQYDPPWDPAQEEYIPPIDHALQEAVPELDFDVSNIDNIRLLTEDVRPLTASTPESAGPPTPFDELDDKPEWRISDIEIPRPGAQLEEANCTEDLNAEGSFFFEGEVICGRAKASRCQNKNDTKNAVCRACHDGQVTGAAAEETNILDSSKLRFCEDCQRELEKARLGHGRRIKGVRFRKCHCFMQLQDTWLCSLHQRHARQQITSRILSMILFDRAKEGRCGRCHKNEGTGKEAWKCIACKNVVLAYA